MKKQKISQLTFTALMAAIICIAAPFSIPIPFSVVPVSLATFAVYVSAAILGWKFGTMSVMVYLLLGLVGIPVFSGWSAGVQVLAGPTGGYLIGYLLIAICTGVAADKWRGKIVYQVAAMIIGTVLCYTVGTIWLGMSLHLSAKAALSAGVLPFILGDAVKIAAAVSISYPVRKQVMQIVK